MIQYSNLTIFNLDLDKNSTRNRFRSNCLTYIQRHLCERLCGPGRWLRTMRAGGTRQRHLTPCPVMDDPENSREAKLNSPWLIKIIKRLQFQLRPCEKGRASVYVPRDHKCFSFFLWYKSIRNTFFAFVFKFKIINYRWLTKTHHLFITRQTFFKPLSGVLLR